MPPIPPPFKPVGARRQLDRQTRPGRERSYPTSAADDKKSAGRGHSDPLGRILTVPSTFPNRKLDNSVKFLNCRRQGNHGIRTLDSLEGRIEGNPGGMAPGHRPGVAVGGRRCQPRLRRGFPRTGDRAVGADIPVPARPAAARRTGGCPHAEGVRRPAARKGQVRPPGTGPLSMHLVFDRQGLRGGKHLGMARARQDVLEKRAGVPAPDHRGADRTIPNSGPISVAGRRSLRGSRMGASAWNTRRNWLTGG